MDARSRQSIIQAGMSTRVYRWNLAIPFVVGAEADNQDEVGAERLIATHVLQTGKRPAATGKGKVSLNVIIIIVYNKINFRTFPVFVGTVVNQAIR